MMHKDEELFTNVLFATACGAKTSSETKDKMKYEKPMLDFVKFTFENDITWGSFEYSRDNGNGDNDATPSADWWDD